MNEADKAVAAEKKEARVPERMPKKIEDGLYFMRTVLNHSGDTRRRVTVYATEAVPADADRDTMLIVWFKNGLKDSTLMRITVKLSDARECNGFGLAFVGIPRSRLPKELGDRIDRFVF